jgi:hypothetical protein
LLINPSRKKHFDLWREMFAPSNEEAAKRCIIHSAQAIDLLFKAAAKKVRGRNDRLPAVWQSFEDWLVHVTVDFKLESEIEN